MIEKTGNLSNLQASLAASPTSWDNDTDSTSLLSSATSNPLNPLNPGNLNIINPNTISTGSSGNGMTTNGLLSAVLSFAKDIVKMFMPLITGNNSGASNSNPTGNNSASNSDRLPFHWALEPGNGNIDLSVNYLDSNDNLSNTEEESNNT